MSMFECGQEIKTIYFSDDTHITAGESCDSIEVVMENGQMAGVPWFAVVKDGKMDSKWNAALVAGVKY